MNPADGVGRLAPLQEKTEKGRRPVAESEPRLSEWPLPTRSNFQSIIGVFQSTQNISLGGQRYRSPTTRA